MSQLRYLLEDQLSALRDMQALLLREGKSVLAGEEMEIRRLAGEKQRLLDALANVGQGVERLLADVGAEGPAALDDYIEGAEDAEALRSLRGSIGDALRDCSELNRANGAVLECNRAASERALQVLLSPAGDADLYQATGRLDNGGSGKSIGSA